MQIQLETMEALDRILITCQILSFILLVYNVILVAGTI